MEPSTQNRYFLILNSYLGKPVDDLEGEYKHGLDRLRRPGKSECGLEGILIKTDVDAIRANDFEGMGLDYFHKSMVALRPSIFLYASSATCSQEIAMRGGSNS